MQMSTFGPRFSSTNSIEIGDNVNLVSVSNWTTMARVSTGVMGFGTNGNYTGTIEAGAFLPGVLYSAAGTPLPSCASGVNGLKAEVSDATSPTYMGAYTSGGAITAAVICSYNGTTYSWLTE